MARRTTQRKCFQLETLETREVLSTVAPPASVPISVAAPTAEQQYALDLVNAIRTNPGAAATSLTANLSPSTQASLSYYGVNLQQQIQEISGMQSRQPLAWNNALAQAAQSHSQDMATNGFQSHTGSDGSSPSDRVASAGYSGAIRTAENAYAYGDSIDQDLQAFLLDWGVPDQGHRKNLLEPSNGGSDSFKEVGIGIVNATRPGFGTVMTQEFGVRANQPADLLGVAYNDNNHDGQYSIGEGQGGVVVEAIAQNGTIAAVQTAAPGGYQIPLQPGTYEVRVFKGNSLLQDKSVQIGSQNIEMDIVLNKLSPINTPSTPVVQAQQPPVTQPVTVSLSRSVTVPTSATVISNNNTAATLPSPGFSWNTWRTVPMI
jgi:uncharacterized protein YkwD